jgi:hypothetical protein
MDVRTGETYSDKEFAALFKNAEKHNQNLMRLPSDIKEDSIYKLQNKNLSASERRSIINKLHKRRKKNKLAKKSKRKNR